MKKLLIGVLSLGLVAIGGTAIYAQSSASNGEGIFNYGQMSQFMEEVHPEQSKEELKDMYNAMHGTNGAAQSANFKDMSDLPEDMGNMNNVTSENVDLNQMHKDMQGQLSSEDINTMTEFMQETNGPVNYGQMKSVMEKVHPQWSKEQIKGMYNSMHGTNGAAPSSNFSEMNQM